MVSQKVVLITGCSNGGIGAALATEFVLKGCLIYATARSVSAMSDLTHENIRKLVLEVTDDDSVKTLVDDIYSDVGRIDILISNAGVTSIGPLLDMSVKNAQEIMNVNFLGSIRLVNAILPRMAKAGKGILITIGSLCGELGTPFSGLYNASKAALHTYTETLSQECRPLGIQVMLVSAGPVISNIANNQAKIYKMPDDSLYKDFTNQIIRRLYVSQGKNAMPTAVFAQKVVSKILSRRPPSYVCTGGNTMPYYILKWLPRTFGLWFLWKFLARP